MAPAHLRNLIFIGALAAAFGAAGCITEDGAAYPDAAALDAAVDGATADGPATDGARADGLARRDATTPDAAPPRRDAAPKPDAGSRCKAGLTLAPLALDRAYCLMGAYAIPAASAYHVAFVNLFTYERDPAAKPTGFQITRWLLDAAAGKAVKKGVEARFKPTLSGTLFPGQFLARTVTDVFAAGYTGSGKGFPGTVHVAGRGVTAQVTAPGNFDALFFDATSLLINGKGAGTATGQGVYYVKLKAPPFKLIDDDPAMASGFLALGKNVLFAGHYDLKAFKAKLYAFSYGEVTRAIKTKKSLKMATDGDLVFSGSVADAVALGDSLVVLATRWSKGPKFSALTRVPVTVTGDKVTAGKASAMATAAKGTDVPAYALVRSHVDRVALVYEPTAGKRRLALIVAR